MKSFLKEVLNDKVFENSLRVFSRRMTLETVDKDENAISNGEKIHL